VDNIKKILVPLECTQYSQGVFNCAVQIAMNNADASIIVLSVINSRDIKSVESIVSMGYDVDAEHYVDEIKKDRKQKLNKMADEAKIDKDKVKILFKIGKPVDEIFADKPLCYRMVRISLKLDNFIIINTDNKPAKVRTVHWAGDFNYFSHCFPH